MRLNKYLANNTELSRRKADSAIENGRVKIDNVTAELGSIVENNNIVSLDGVDIIPKSTSTTTILLNKPVGYVCSKNGQGSPTVYDLLPEIYTNLNIAGRLDKDSSGLVILTDDGILLNELTHPSNNKEKIYEVEINGELKQSLIELVINGVEIGDSRPSKFKKIEQTGPKTYRIILEEGRNRQIRRTFEKLGFDVTKLNRIQIGKFKLDNITVNTFSSIY